MIAQFWLVYDDEEREFLLVGESPEAVTVIEYRFPTMLSALRWVRKWSRDRRLTSTVDYTRDRPVRYNKTYTVQ